uniref:Uncharacterized protein n=1 Tax=Chromera velia CCMP2878 TaxID=1169474 RepID=A0A0G4I132_9ALVE|eukprot:Cvel_10056.t1-p1 / transcript=Cvel_10056.t1 / gene=Cvel_10056 / organism=Chromera_velia_CCMP2878 / gene_product=hypothetical protein / transcript_product=hypothetical protein / location=Cvel_scaffold598:48797-49516(+) / protein_length=240 / sequence_SO=supercontig / SO=protein_coding / is_pseudo=false
MFTNFRSLFTLSTSDSPNVEKYIEMVKSACRVISRLSLQEEVVPVWSGVGDKTDLSTWRVENKLVPLLDPLTRRQGQLASLVLINGISDSTVHANVESSIAPHMPFEGDDGAVAKFRHFAQPSCFSRLPATPSVPEQTHGVNMTGRSTNSHPRSCASGPSCRRPHCEHRSHRLEECLKQHYCSDYDHWGHKTGDCELARDHFALLRAYGYSGGGGGSRKNGGGQGKRGRQPTESGRGRAR